MKIVLLMLLENLKHFFLKHKYLITIFLVMIIAGIVTVPKIFAQLPPIESIEIFSEKLDYNSKEPGAWKITKSAKWTSKGEAEIIFDVDSKVKTNNKATDVLLVLDISESMEGEKISRVKQDSIELIESVLSKEKNKVGLITFDSGSEIVSDFTNELNQLKSSINTLNVKGTTNYYSALLSVGEVLKKYTKEKDKECIVLFLTDGYPCEETPNEVGQYAYLKEQYPFVEINGIQYEMGNSISTEIKNVSDKQFIANKDTLNNTLFEATLRPVVYDNFEISDYIDRDYFYVESSSDIKTSQGNIIFDQDSQKVTWSMSDYMSGAKPKMTIKVHLKDELVSQDGNFPTNKSEEVVSKIGEDTENVLSNKTPVLKSKYNVIYDANVPDGCTVTGIVPNDESHFTFDSIEISNSILTCTDYQFKGWEISTKGVVKINADHFTMPEKDVTIRGVWSKLSLIKSMDGEVKEYVPATLERYTSGSTNGIHKYNDSLTNIIFQNSMSPVNGAVDILDISAEENRGILAYIVPNDSNNSSYTAYIQGDGDIIANENSSSLFRNFTNLKSIQNLEYLDTSNVTSMIAMFRDCSSLINLNLSVFDTSQVTDMYDMFRGCSSLTSLDLSNFDTSKVTDMFYMFTECSNLSTLNLSSFDTTNVTDMNGMFYNCSSLNNLNLDNFDTSNVTTMKNMFNSCSSLTNLNLSNFKTSNVTSMETMFYNCSNLNVLDLSGFKTSKVTSMLDMFRSCSSLESLNVNNFDTSSVTTDSVKSFMENESY